MGFNDNPPEHRRWLGVLIAKRRITLGYSSVKDCADFIGISDTTLRDLERGQGSAKWDTNCLVSDKLGLGLWGGMNDIDSDEYRNATSRSDGGQFPRSEEIETVVRQAGGSKLLAMMHALNAGAEITTKFPARKPLT